MPLRRCVHLKRACGVVSASQMGCRTAARAHIFRASLDIHDETIVLMTTDVNIHVFVVLSDGADDTYSLTFS